MKGKLIQESYGWVIRYKKNIEPSPWYELDLYPADVLSYNSDLIEYHDKDVNLHVVSHYEYDDTDCCKKYGSCENYVGHGIGECTKANIIRKQYAKLVISGESDNWEDIIDDITDLYGIMVDVKVREYLEENYNVPTPKFKQDAE